MIQIETAMGAAIEVFEGAELIEVTRDAVPAGEDHQRPAGAPLRLLPARPTATTSRSPTGSSEVPFVDLDGGFYKLVHDFDERFPDGVPSLRSAEELTVEGDWTFEAGVAVEGRAHLDGPGGRVEAGRTLGG